ncbi:hypothetical protein tinsulaeT_31260 [Thalassotalea insulae]|uniref:Chitin-binding type-3 domain-containing protein n=1 Tax=Thalassotalea insulae TaxID=2056778 RepID=A0ABQ6GYU7_9GAMM|nr:carbohydrate-binding protein [Thalassotalea insulae]GLX79786.1 hypothetical protein tinsulaeT_31260 [Thalassotalea insulae]
MKKFALTTAISLAIACHANAANGGVQDFLDSVRNFESGINPYLADFYAQNLNNPVYTYAKVTAPGRLVRDCATGSMVSEPTTINEFFTKLGIDDIYNPATPNDAQMFKQMQYNSMNAWGFVGYQLGEAVLIDSGYYSPNVVTIDGVEYDSFYMFVDDSTWIGCKTEALAEIPGSGGNKVYVTDINKWQGTFTGRNGVNSFADLVKPEKQELVMRDAMRFNYSVISGLLEDANMTWTQALAKTWPGYDDDNNPITIQATMSGILAAAHLRGAWGVGALLTKDQITCDELGTCITKYVYKFGGYNTIFDTPADDTIEGSSYNETMSAGWGNDIVITGGGVDIIELNEQANAVTTIQDFTVGEDRIILRDWANSSPLANLTVTDTTNGAQLQFASQNVVINGVTASQISADTEAVIVNSNVYAIAWSGKQTVNNFDPAVDKVKGTAGIGFKHLKAYETDNALVIGVQAADGGIYSSITLTGLTLADLSAEMFTNVTGGFDRLGYIVPLSSQNWGWNKVLTINNFSVEKTVISMPLFNYSFSQLELTQDGNNAILSLVDATSGGDNKQLILLNTNVSELSATNFEFVNGNYSDITIDIPVFYPITATVNGSGGSISPTPDSNNVINAKGGSDYTVNFNADAGFKVASITVDGQTVATASSYTFPGLNAAHTLSVTFEPGVSCPAQWDAASVYTGGMQATYNGKIYQARWWSQNNNPESGAPWDYVEDCQ